MTLTSTRPSPKKAAAIRIEWLRAIQLSKTDVLETLCKGRPLFTFREWRDLLLRSVGLEPSVLGDRTCDVMLLRMVPFVENNYNAVELGPRGTGKSHLYQQVSPYAHLVSGGKATVAKMFVNNANGQRPRLSVRRRLLRRGLRNLLESEGRCEHHEGLHGVGRVQPWADIPGLRRNGAGRQF